MIGDARDLANFFQNENLVEMVDFMARRYGKLPHEILEECDVFQFTFSMTTMLRACELEAKRNKEAEPKSSHGGGKPPKEEVTFRELGVAVKTVSINEDNDGL